VGTASIAFVQNPLPTVKLTAKSLDVCVGSQADITADTTGTIKSILWNPTNSGFEIKPTIAKEGNNTFTAQVVSTSDCKSAVADITINGVSAPDPVVELYKKADNTSIVAGDKLCPGTSFYPVFSNAKLSGLTQDITYSLRVGKLSAPADNMVAADADGVKANQNGAYNYSVNASTTYLYSAQSALGCQSATKSFTIDVANVPSVSITGPKTFCEGSTTPIDLKASSTEDATTWKWEDPVPAADQTKKTVSIVPAALTYTVTGTTKYGCSSSASWTLTQNPKPTVGLKVSDAEICAGSPVTVTADTAAGSDKAYITAINWSPLASNTAYSITPTLDATTNYSATVTNNYGCTSDAATASVKVLPLPAPTIALYKVSDNAKIDVATTKLCPGDGYYPVLSNATGTDKDITFTVWRGTEAKKVFDPIPDGSSANTSGADLSYVIKTNENIYYTAKSSLGCASKGTGVITISVASAPVISVNGTQSFCQGDASKLKLSASSIDATVNTWTWDAPISKTTANVEIDPVAGSYTVYGTNGNGCMGKRVFTITELAKPTFRLEAPAEVCAGSVADVKVVDTLGTMRSVAWNPSTLGSSTTYSVSPVVSSTTTYSAQLTATNGCKSDAVSVTVKAGSAPIPEVTIYNKNTGAVIAAGTKLCPGTVYYPVFKNNVTAHDPSKTITYTFSDGKTSHDITVIDGDGVEANVDATYSYVMDGTVNFSYSAKSSLGCASGINTFTIAQAAQPNISIVGDSLFCEDAKVSRTLQASSTASIDEANWSWTSPVMGAASEG
jgi:hypothetical protein